MGSSHSAEQNGRSPSSTRDTKHLLLAPIDVPVNRFCDDFVSVLTDELDESPEAADSSTCYDPLELDSYRTTKIIGHGAQGFVYQATDLATGRLVAVKLYRRGDAPREVEIARDLDHPHVLKVLNCFVVQRGRDTGFAVVLPLAEHGSLSNAASPAISVVMSLELLSQIGDALAYMHSRNVVHRDVKPQNILLAAEGFVLCDFSAAVALTDDNQMLNDQIGTSVFMAPEVASHAYRPKPADVWSLGISVFALLFGKYPFNLAHFFDNCDIPAHVRVADNVLPFPLVFPDWPRIPPELKDIIASILQKDPERRTTAPELVRNEWLVGELEEWAALTTFMTGSD
jgi:serine/threonine protein kinase